MYLLSSHICNQSKGHIKEDGLFSFQNRRSNGLWPLPQISFDQRKGGFWNANTRITLNSPPSDQRNSRQQRIQLAMLARLVPVGIDYV